MTISASFNINIPDKEAFMNAVADYMGCDQTQVTNEDIEGFIKEHVKSAKSTSSAFVVMDENTGVKFISSIDKSSISRLYWN